MLSCIYYQSVIIMRGVGTHFQSRKNGSVSITKLFNHKKQQRCNRLFIYKDHKLKMKKKTLLKMILKADQIKLSPINNN